MYDDQSKNHLRRGLFAAEKLVLYKRIAESMGERISVLSELSAGSTFNLHLQTAKGEDVQTVMAPSHPAASSCQ